MTKKFFLLLIAILSAFSALALFACNDIEEEEKTFLTVDDIASLPAVQRDGTLYFEWLREYDPNKPTVVFFHGEENSESTFTINLLRSVYTEDVMSKTAGGDFRMMTTNAGAYFDMGYFWQNVGQYNVTVFHWERFSDEPDAESVIAKIFSTYKSRYKINGTVKTDVFSVPLADVVFALYKKETERVSLSTKEIRFAGAGTGALLAHAVAAKAALYGQKEICPYRVALCDAPLSDGFVTFDTSWLNTVSSRGTIGLVSAMNGVLRSKGTAMEIYETKEKGTTTQYAYDYEKGSRGDSFSLLKKEVAYLEIAESYSVGAAFDLYKTQKRLALDWYIYSIIGSDDRSVGCGTVNADQNLAANNRGPNNSRPILNERLISNVEPEKYGRNYGLSAWTPTVYVRGLRGVSFSQKTDGVRNGYDVNGKERYVYREEYVLTAFSSENYQVSDVGSYSVLCGYVYYDKNKNDLLDDGMGMGYDNAELNFNFSYTTDSDVIPVFEGQRVYADEDGFYVIRLEDAKSEGEEIRVESKKGLFVVSGVICNKEKSATIYLSFNYPIGLSSYYGRSVGGLFYSEMGGNSFGKNQCTVYFTQETVHSLQVANCMYYEA